MITDSNIQTEIDGIRELSHAEVEVVTGAGFFGDLWDSIKSLGSGLVDAASDLIRFVNVFTHPGRPLL